MKLEDIGFYTLSDERAENASETSRLMRAEILISGNCNFSCPYCRHIGGPDANLEDIISIIDRLSNDNLFAIRLSGGEPTIHPDLLTMVKYAFDKGIEKIALSTNGSADIGLYNQLIVAGVNDMSISLDSCCSADANVMSGGGIGDMWEEFIANIRAIAEQIYVTAGVVLNEDNKDKVNDIINFAHELGVSDIRVIPAAQDSSTLQNIKIDKTLLAIYPILNYRYNNILHNKPVRGLSEHDPHKCPLVLDDVAIMGDKHYPCIIYMRESGDYIGKIGDNMREDRKVWFEVTDTHIDPICSKQCLDVCQQYNSKYLQYHKNH